MVGDKDCQALWMKLSEDYYPIRNGRSEGAWLTAGEMMGLVHKHAREYLRDASDTVR
jgi:hypothetical protein